MATLKSYFQENCNSYNLIHVDRALSCPRLHLPEKAISVRGTDGNRPTPHSVFTGHLCGLSDQRPFLFVLENHLKLPWRDDPSQSLDHVFPVEPILPSSPQLRCDPAWPKRTVPPTDHSGCLSNGLNPTRWGQAWPAAGMNEREACPLH